jgi:hypothetical protein
MTKFSVYRKDSFPWLRLLKVAVSSVPYGDSISHNGRTVWAAYYKDELISLGGVRDEALSKYAVWWANLPMEVRNSAYKASRAAAT